MVVVVLVVVLVLVLGVVVVVVVVVVECGVTAVRVVQVRPCRLPWYQRSYSC